MMAMARSEQDQDHVLQSLQAFSQLLHARMPLLKHRHFSEFHSDEAQILETCRLVKVEVIQQFVAKISHLLSENSERSTELFKDLNTRIQVKINDLLVKNKQLKNECEAFLKRRMEDITEDIKSTMEVELKLNRVLEKESMADMLEAVIRRGMEPFENYRRGNIDFFEQKRVALIEALGELKKEMVGKFSTPMDQNQNTSSPSSNEAVQVQAKLPVPVNGGFHQVAISSSSSSQNQAMNPPLDETSQDPDDNQEAVELVVNSQCPPITPPRSTDRNRRKVGRPAKIRAIKYGDGADTPKRPKRYQTVSSGISAKSDGDVVPGSSKSVEISSGIPDTVPVTPTPAKCHPLIFRLSTNSISIGTKVGESFIRLPCQRNGELFLPPVLAIDNYGVLLSGAEAANFFNPNDDGDDQYWSLQHFFASSSSSSKHSEMVTFRIRIGMEKRSQALTLEFFLGLLLNNLKTSAESNQKLKFTEAVITVPIWFSSYHRIQIKDAARIAGFSVVNLVNQEAVAACALVHIQEKEKQRSKPRGDILVLTENFGILSAVLYRYCPNTKDLEMIGDHHVAIDEDIDRDLIGRMQMVCGLSASLFLRSDAGGVNEMKYVFLTESHKWLKTFSEIFGRSEGHGAEDLFGCGTICQNIVQEMYDGVVEYLPKGLGLHLWKLFSKPKVSLVDKVKFKLPLESLLLEDGTPKLFQGNIHSENEPVPLGQIEFRGRAKYAEEFVKNAIGNCRLDLVFQIDSEGVITLGEENIKVTKIKKNGKELLQKEDFVWKSFNLDGVKWKEIKMVVKLVCSESYPA